MYTTPGLDWTPVGKHLHRFEPPDIYVVCVHGGVTEEEILAHARAILELGLREERGIFWLTDLTHFRTISPAARRVTTRPEIREVVAMYRGAAMFGLSFSTRVLVQLTIKAYRKLRPGQQRPVGFCATEPEARAFIEILRRGEIT